MLGFLICLLFSADDEYDERSVSVSLDGEESELIFIDHKAGEMSVSFWMLSWGLSFCKKMILG